MTNPEEQKTAQDSHISRILAGDDMGKAFDKPVDAGNKKGGNIFSDLFDPHEWRFIIWSGVVFILCILAFSMVGSLFNLFTSDDLEQSFANSSSTQSSAISPSNVAIELPNRIQIPKIGIDIEVRNPHSTSYEVLDNELTKGAVRYPGSGYPGKGNMLLFGHSTGYKVVRNQAYKAFNNIKTLEVGDPIFIYTEGKTYEYRVRSVAKVNKFDTKISFEGVGDMITLSTCDSFGTKSDRYVVEADLVI